MALNFGGNLFAGREALVNYDWVDLADGTGIKLFYPGTASGAYVLSPNKFYSEKTCVDTIIGPAEASWAINTDFDVTLNLPRTLKGTAIINVPIGVQSDGVAQQYTTIIKATLRKWDGTTETDIASGTGTQWTSASLDTNVYDYNMTMIYLNVPTTHIKRGETLRLTIELYGRSPTLDTGLYFFGCDPMNRASSDYNSEEYPRDAAYSPLTFGTAPSILTAQIPFRIDQ